MQAMYYDIYGKEPPIVIDKEKLSNFVSNATEGVKDGIFAVSSGVGNADLYDSNGLLTQSDEILDAAKIGGTALGFIGSALDAYNVYKSIKIGDIESTCVQIGGIALGTVGAILGAAAGVGWFSIVGGTMGAIAGTELGEKAGKWVYDTGKLVQEKINK